MVIDDGRVLATNGAMLAEGTISFRGEEAGTFLKSSNALIAVSCRPSGDQHTRFELLPNPIRRPEGLWSAETAIHSLALHPSVPPLEDIAGYPGFALTAEGRPSRSMRLAFTADHSAVAWIAADTRFGERPSVLGSAKAGWIELTREDGSLAIIVEAEVPNSKRGDQPAPPFTVRVDARLSAATLLLAGLSLAGRIERAFRQPSEQEGPLAKVLTLDTFAGQPLLRGTLDLGGTVRSEWIILRHYSRRVFLSAVSLWDEPRGFVSSRTASQDLILEGHSFDDWSAMLGDQMEAALKQQGSGIGRIEGLTGRDAYEEGAHEQQIVAATTRLVLSEEGLRFTFEGELGPLRQAKGRSLGPRVLADFLVPTALLLARGMRHPFLDALRYRRD